MQLAVLAMIAIRTGLLLSLFGLSTACASSTTRVRRTATPQYEAAEIAVDGPSNQAPTRESVFANVAPRKRKLLEGALISTLGGGCWDAQRHALITAEMVATDGTPYFTPHELAIDLDGDGVLDPVVEVDRDGDSVRYELYLKRGGCAQHLGSVRLGGTIVGALGKANGYRTLEVAGLCDSAGPCRDVVHSELTFDGNGWRATKHWTTPTK